MMRYYGEEEGGGEGDIVIGLIECEAWYGRE